MPAITVSRGPALTIGVLSKRTRVNIETIRFYERIGILPNVWPAPGLQVD